MHERELLQSLAQGSELAFKQLFESYRDRLLAYVNKLVKSRELAEEIAMDVFAKLWLNRELADEIANLERFLFKASTNRAIDFLRKAAKDESLKNVLWEEIQIAGDLNPEHYVIGKDMEVKLSEAIEKLPTQRKLIFKLSREEDLSYEQIGFKLNISKNTVRNQMVKALHFIREQLQANKELVLLLLFLKKF